MATIFVKKNSSGTGDGTTAANAYGQGQLATLLANGAGRASAGDRITLVAEPGVEFDFSTVTITNAQGTASSPIRIVGVGYSTYTGGAGGNNNYIKPRINGGRVYPWTSGDGSGSDIFRLSTGAGHIHFHNLEFFGAGEGGAVSLKAAVSNFYFYQCDFVACGSGFFSDNVAGSNIEFQRCKFLQCAKEAIRLRSSTSGVRVITCFIDSEHIESGNITQAINIRDSVSDVLIQGTTIINSVNYLASGGAPMTSANYIQGDGIVTEASTSNVRVVSCYIAGHTDGGVDMKGSGHLIDDCIFEKNTRNIRVWASTTVVQNTISRNPVERESTNTGACIQFNGGTGNTVKNCTFEVDKVGTSRLLHLTVGTTNVTFLNSKFSWNTDITTFAQGSTGDQYTLTRCLQNGTYVASGGTTF